MFVETNPYAWVEPVTHLGVPGLLMIGIATLWRSYQAERQANMDWQREAIEHQKELEKIPEALDRLRVDTIAEVRAGFLRCGAR